MHTARTHTQYIQEPMSPHGVGPEPQQELLATSGKPCTIGLSQQNNNTQYMQQQQVKAAIRGLVMLVVHDSDQPPSEDCPFYSIIRGQHFSFFGPNYQQRDIRFFFEQNSHQVAHVAHHIHLCFQARMSDESLLAPHPRL